jgi:hypothetical protein
VYHHYKQKKKKPNPRPVPVYTALQISRTERAQVSLILHPDRVVRKQQLVSEKKE